MELINEDDYDYFYLALASSKIVTITMTPITTGFDADLYVRWDGGCPPYGWQCRPYNSGNEPETCTNTLSAGTYYIYVDQFSGSGNYTLSVSCT